MSIWKSLLNDLIFKMNAIRCFLYGHKQPYFAFVLCGARIGINERRKFPYAQRILLNILSNNINISLCSVYKREHKNMYVACVQLQSAESERVFLVSILL